MLQMNVWGRDPYSLITPICVLGGEFLKKRIEKSERRRGTQCSDKHREVV